MYKILRDSIGDSVIRLSDSASIPSDETNTDYKEYLAWVAEGNEASIEEF